MEPRQIRNIVLLALNLPLIPYIARVLAIPHQFLMPMIMFFCLIGVYLVSFNTFDIQLMAIFAAAAVGLRLLDFPMAPMILGFILGGLMEGLFSRGVTLVATSNIEPANLYENGLQRQRFLPAIALVEKYTRVVNVDAGIDYRLRTLQQAELYHYPLDQAADESLQDSFTRLAVEQGKHWERLEINGRYLTCRCIADDVAWFDFAELCDGPRSQNDYIELARIFHAVLISGVPAFTPMHNDQARRFVNLVDEFYDRNVKLVLAAERPLLDLYQGGSLEFEFQRTISRLQEMQSYDYLAREHKP